MKSRPIDKTIARYIKRADEKEKGLTLISAGTGKGKTYAIIDYIESALENERYDRVIFIAPRHNLLTETKEKLEQKNIGKTLYLHSSLDNLLTYYSSIESKNIKDRTIAEYITKLGGIDQVAIAKERNHLPEEIAASYIKLKNELRTYMQNRKTKGNDDSDYNEVHKIYPEDISGATKVILMTMDKLFYRLDTLKRDNLILSKALFTDKTLVVIDELDKCYDIALNNLATDRNDLDDLLSLIQTARQFVSDSDPRWRRMEDDEQIMEERRELCKNIDNAHKKFGILNNFEFDNPTNDRVELFVSRSQTIVASQRGKHYYLSIKPQKTTLGLSKTKTGFSLPSLAITCKDLVRDILNLIYHVGQNYQKNVKSVTYEESILFGISQVLNRTSSEAQRLINYATINSIKTQSLRINDNEYLSDISVCNNGFSHCYFENSPGSNHSYLRTSGIDLTPENILVWLARNSNVIALSATGQIPTVLNPDLNYIRRCINDALDVYSSEEFEDSVQNCSSRENISAKIIRSFDSDCTKLVKSIVKDFVPDNTTTNPENIENVLFEYLDCIQENDFKQNREYKRFYSICDFLFSENAISGLMLLSENFNYLFQVKKFVKNISSLLGNKFDITSNIYCVDASNYNRYLNEIQNKLNNGQRCLVISNRQAIGQGVNIQYDRDFNFFYQEEPTNVVPNQSPIAPLSQSEVNKLVYLLMKLQSNGECTEQEIADKIVKIVNKQNIGTRNLASIKNAKTIAFIQGLGRTSRTGSKEDHIYINIDEALCEDIDFNALMVEMTPELLAVKKCVEKYTEEKEHLLIDNMSNEERELCKNSNRLQGVIEQLLTIFTDQQNPALYRERAREQYQNLLDFLLKYGPHIPATKQFTNDEKTLFDMLGYVYFDCDPPKEISFYSRNNAYCENIISCSVKKKQNFKCLKFSTLKALKSYELQKNRCWVINPKGFNLLQGALGEHKFKEAFESVWGSYKLNELPLNEFEICGDYIVENTDIYVDVKNFNEDGGTKNITDFAIKKLESIKKINEEGKLIVVNVFAENKYMDPVENVPDIYAVTNVIDKTGIKRDILTQINEWIDDNT